MLNDNRIRIIIGHFGSGKTEFAMNYAMKLSEMTNDPIALADLDIVNPYFRSRQKAKTLEARGIEVISSARGNKYDNADIPMVSAGVLKIFQTEGLNGIIDVGGDAAGARPMVRYKAYLTKGNYDMFAVINRYRQETSTVEGAIKHIKSIEAITNAKVTGLINNTHLLRETSVEDVMYGQVIVREVSKQLGIPIKYVCALESIAGALKNETFNGEIFPIKLYMREDWM